MRGVLVEADIAYANFLARKFAAIHKLTDDQANELARLCMLAARYATHSTGPLWHGQAVHYARRAAGVTRA